MSQRPRVLVVEDDASIRTLVSLALEDEPIELLMAESVPAALRQLESQPVRLLITDLMMPGLSGFDLLTTLRDRPELRNGACLAVFSAGLADGWQARLEVLGVQRIFTKPMALEDLIAGIRALLKPSGAAQRPAEPAALCEDGFSGDEMLRQAFVASCLQQWPQDALDGDRACAESAPQSMRRVAHNLKGCLDLLGARPEAELALRLERACAEGSWPPQGQALWGDLKTSLQILAARLRPMP